jgi:uncharacterized protein Usg
VDLEGGDERMRRQHDDLVRQLDGYRLATAEIVYHMPDHPGLLQTFIWQHLDIAPHYPELHRFLDFWVKNIEARIHSVTVGRTKILTPTRYTRAAGLFQLH